MLRMITRHSAHDQVVGGLPEAACWSVGLLLLALMEPAGEHLFSLCPVSWVLETGCPGCGLGRSIAYLFRAEWLASWQAHPLGLPAVLVLCWRIGSLSRQSLRMYKHSSNKTNHGTNL
jgi:hypothetical protein